MAKKTKKKKTAKRSTLIGYADDAWSRYIRLSNADKNGYVWCVTCLEAFEAGSNHKPRPMFWRKDGAEAGHFMPKGNGATAVRWLLHNGETQCSWCNNHKSGAQADFQRFLDRKYGQEIVDDLRARKFQTVKYTDDEIREITDLYNEFADELERKL